MAANPRIRAQDWAGKTVWLIGASTGIGQALAHDLAALGARLALSARNAERLQAACEALPKCVGTAQTHLPLPLDFTDAAAVQAAWSTLCTAWGAAPEVVIVNAGGYEPMLAQDFDLDRALLQMRTNVDGPLHVLAALLPTYSGRHTQSAQSSHSVRGHIVLVSSVAGYRALPKALVYGASKAALSYMAEALYLELAPRGVAVTLIKPGFVQTPLTAGNDFHMPALQTPEQASSAILKGLAQGVFEIHFPKRFTWFLKALGALPRWAYMALVRKLL